MFIKTANSFFWAIMTINILIVVMIFDIILPARTKIVSPTHTTGAGRIKYFNNVKQLILQSYFSFIIKKLIVQ